MSVNFHLMTAPESFGTQLKKWLKNEGISQGELARRIGKSAQYVSYLVRDMSPSASSGKPRPPVEVIDRIARVLHVPLAEARIAAGYAPPKSKSVLSDDDRALEYLRSLPRPIRMDALAILETLWRRHAGEAGIDEGSHEPPEEVRSYEAMLEAAIEMKKGFQDKDEIELIDDFIKLLKENLPPDEENTKANSG